MKRTSKLLNSDRIASGTDNSEAVYSVERYMNDLLAMHTLIRPVSDSISRLFTVYEQMSNTTDSQELDALSSEAKELTAKVTTVYASKVKGVSYSKLLERIIDGYSGGALASFDALCDEIYNWYPQRLHHKCSEVCRLAL